MALFFIGSLLLTTPSHSAIASPLQPSVRKVGEQNGQGPIEPNLSDVSARGARRPSPSTLEIRFHKITVGGKTKYFVDEVAADGPFAKRYIPGKTYDELPTPATKTRGLAADAKSDPENSKRDPSH